MIAARAAGLLACWATTAAPLAGQAEDATDALVRAQMEVQNIPGLSLAVIADGGVVKVAGYGVANRETGAPASPATVYRIASVSKQFIAAGIMLLVQDGRVHLDDPVTRYLDGAPATWDAITLRHLLTHTSGLVREGPAFDPAQVRPDADVIRSAYDEPLRFAPGTGWEYSNLGYFALAEVIRVVSGRPWPDFLDERIFAPLDMASTRPTSAGVPVPDRAVGYTDNDRLDPAPDWPALRPSGAFLSTVLDLAKWDLALRGDRVLADSTRRAMWEPVGLADGGSYPYGFGWQLGDVDGHRVVYHLGGMTGFRAGFARFVDDGLSVIVLMNLSDVDPYPILFGVARLHLSGEVAPGGRDRRGGATPAGVSRAATPRRPRPARARTAARGCRAR